MSAPARRQAASPRRRRSGTMNSGRRHVPRRGRSRVMSASLRRALEDELAASPDDVATHAAYADLLDEMGDVRGEFIQVQLALEDDSLDAAHRKQLSRREAELLRDHADRLLGPLAPHLTGEG